MKEDEKILTGHKGADFAETGVIYAPYIPIISMETVSGNFKYEGIKFTEYDQNLDYSEDGVISFLLGFYEKAHAFEQEDGTIVVFERSNVIHVKTKIVTLKNREEFNEMYFTEAI